MRMNLDGCWTLSFTHPADGWRVAVETRVPGNVEQALEEHGFLADAMPADDANAAALFNQVDDWTYAREFDAPELAEGWTCELVFEGIDTIADIRLNGEAVCHTEDMFVPHRVDVRGRLKPTGNKLEVVIRSAVLWARRQPMDAFSASREANCYASQPYLRKARHEWGWDNAPRLLTAGLYRSVRLETLPPDRFDNVYLYTARVTEERVDLGILWNCATSLIDMSGCRLRCTLRSAGAVAFESDAAVDFPRGALRFSVPRERVALWWPAGYGEAALSHVRLALTRGETTLAEWEADWGIRTIRLERSEEIDENDQGEFVFLVNNERIYIRGANWKPLDALHARADARLSRALALATELNCNMIRVWGGGVYEDHAFFDYCDRHGIMVWQDFMFACEFPPCDDSFCKKVEWETRVIIEKLRNHASLAVWCGDNEDDQALSWIHGASNLLPSDNRITREVLRRCVLRYDPYRSYVPSSPYCSDAFHRAHQAGDPALASVEDHLYPPTVRFSEALRACRSRFIGETGPIIINAMTDNPRIFAREEARVRRLWNVRPSSGERSHTMHQWDSYFLSWRQTGRELCELWFGRDFSADEWRDWALAVNIICSHVFKDVIEYCRTERWRKTGVIWWSLMDMWPMLFNYSVVDCDFRRKLPFYWIRQSQQPFLLAAVRKTTDGEAALYACNDTARTVRGRYRVLEADETGAFTLIAQGRLAEPANGARLVQRLPEADETRLWLISWETETGVGWNHFATGDGHASFETWRRWHGILRGVYGIPG